MRLFVFFVLTPFLLAQTAVVGTSVRPATSPAAPEAAPPETPPEDLCTVSGQVANAVSGEFLKKATLNLQRMDAGPNTAGLPRSYTTSTDAEGKFAMKDIEPGRYQLSATHNGFVRMEYGAHSPARPG